MKKFKKKKSSPADSFLLDEALLIDVLSQQSYSERTKQFRNWIQRYCYLNFGGSDIKLEVDNGNLYVTKGTASLYPCIVSHIDTVHKINNCVDIYKAGSNLFAYDYHNMKQYGIGGDDKVGVYICLMMLHHLDYVKAAFFRDEEVGCIGSGKAKKEFFDDCAFVLQCDRRGNSDFVTSINDDICSKEWIDELKPIWARYGYSESMGMMTDVEALKKAGIDICMNNISCGYYHPHCDDEYVNVDDVAVCTTMVYEIMRDKAFKRWQHKYEFKPYGYYKGGWPEYGWDSWAGNKSAYSGGTVSGKQQNLFPTKYNKSVPDTTTEYNDGFYDKWEWVRGEGWVLKSDGVTKLRDTMKDELIAAKDEVKRESKLSTDVAKHGETNIDKQCLACQNVGMTYDAHSEDWWCWYCSEYEGTIMAAIRQAESDKKKDQEKDGAVI